MKRNALYIFLAAIALVLTSAVAFTGYPATDITNGIVQAKIYLPDTANGYYRATRFDWSGVIPELSFDGHTYCAPWFDNYAPTTNDAIMGPVESFSPLGYDEAAPGGRFVQVGVGTLAKQENVPYSPFKYYTILNAGTWQVKKKAASIAFIHLLQDSLYSYRYEKTLTLLKGKPVLAIHHSLTNTGQQTIETSVYNHNLFVFDKQPPGPDFHVHFGFIPTGKQEGQKGFGANDIAMLKDSGVLFNRTPEKRESAYSILEGFGSGKASYNIKIENHATGAAVRITGDRPLSKLAFWSSSRIFSPEPFIKISIIPGETFTWTIWYEFYTCPIQK